VPLLGEALDGVTLAFAAAVVLTVVIGKQFSRPSAPANPAVGTASPLR